jgi:hypothetical protein
MHERHDVLAGSADPSPTHALLILHGPRENALRSPRRAIQNPGLTASVQRNGRSWEVHRTARGYHTASVDSRRWCRTVADRPNCGRSRRGSEFRQSGRMGDRLAERDWRLRAAAPKYGRQFILRNGGTAGIRPDPSIFHHSNRRYTCGAVFRGNSDETCCRCNRDGRQ